jgi:hypothetical protein
VPLELAAKEEEPKRKSPARKSGVFVMICRRVNFV